MQYICCGVGCWASWPKITWGWNPDWSIPCPTSKFPGSSFACWPLSVALTYALLQQLPWLSLKDEDEAGVFHVEAAHTPWVLLTLNSCDGFCSCLFSCFVPVIFLCVNIYFLTKGRLAAISQHRGEDVGRHLHGEGSVVPMNVRWG